MPLLKTTVARGLIRPYPVPLKSQVQAQYLPQQSRGAGGQFSGLATPAAQGIRNPEQASAGPSWLLPHGRFSHKAAVVVLPCSPGLPPLLLLSQEVC